MAKHFYSYQFDMPYRPTYLRNWEVPKYYCPKPRRRIGSTKIISNVRGHLLPGVYRPVCNPFGDILGTWEMPKRITREIANKINGSADKKEFLEKCKIIAATPPKLKYYKMTDKEKRKNREEEKKQIKEEEKAKQLEEAAKLQAAIKAKEENMEVKEVKSEEKIICPIHS